MNNDAWTMVALFLGLVGTLSGLCAIAFRPPKPKDPDTRQGRSWYDGYDKGVETTRKIYEGLPTDLERHAIAQEAYNKGLADNRKARAEGYDAGKEDGLKHANGQMFQAGYDKGKLDAQNEKGSYSEGYEKGRSAGFSQGVITGNQRGYEDGKKAAQSRTDATKIDDAYKIGLNQGHQDGYKVGYEAGREDGKNAVPKVSPSRSDAYMDGIKTMADAMQEALPKTPEEVYQQAEKHLLKMGCGLQQFIWVPFTGPHAGGKRP